MQCVLLLDIFIKVFGSNILLRHVIKLRLVAKLQPSPNRHLCGRTVEIVVLSSNSYYSLSSGLSTGRAFEALKTKRSSAPILVYPNFKEEFSVDCDASDDDLGVVESQNI